MNRPLADDGQPKPYQVRLALTALLGTLEPGQPLPPERVLAADFGVSRSTVRHAITDMVAAGLVQRLHGSGTYPVPPKVELPLRLASYTRDVSDQGLRPTSRVVSMRKVASDAATAAALDVEVDAAQHVQLLVRLLEPGDVDGGGRGGRHLFSALSASSIAAVRRARSLSIQWVPE